MTLINLIKNSYPKFTTKIPSSKQQIFFRPLIVKEEKQLLSIQEFGSDLEKLNTIIELVKSCYENINLDTVSVTDLTYLFIQLRIKSIGNEINTNLVCPFTKEVVPIVIDLESVEYTESKNSSNFVELSPTLGIKLTEPMANGLINHSTDSNDILNVVLACMESVDTDSEHISCKDQTKEELELFLNSLTKEQFSKLIQFFENASKIEKKINYKTSDGVERELIMKGILDFFV
jgi:hypothetical protein